MVTVRQVFTDYVRALSPSGEPPDTGSFDRVWAALAKALASEIRRRGLWESSPGFLGVYGAQEWHEAVPGGGSDSVGGALEELLVGCYTHIFVRRLGGLKAQLELKPSIDGLVFVGIRNFLHDLQKKHDPLGFRVFEILRSAVRGALETGELVLLSGDPRVRNDSVLGFSQPSIDSPAPKLAVSEDLDPVVTVWNDVLLPDLITARGAARQRVIALLQTLLLRLPVAGIETVEFKQLIDPLKNDARARWSALLEPTHEESAIEDGEDGGMTQIRLCPPDSGVEERDSFEKLVACVSEAVDLGREPGRIQEYLSTLWEFFRTHAGGTPVVGTTADGPLSARKLATLLRIPRDRIPGLLTTLRAMIEACRAAIPEKRPVNLSRKADNL